MSEVYTASERSIRLWAVGGMADYMLFVSFNALILPVFTTSFGLSPVLVGWALMLPRLLYALIDPALGHLSDNLHTRWGRRRPFIFGSAILGSIMVMALWWPPQTWSQSFQFMYLLVISSMLYFCYGVFSMTHVALGYELSDDYSIRSKVVAVRAFFFSIAGLAGGWLYWLALRPVFGNEIAGIRWVSVGIAVVILTAGLIPVFSARERFQNQNISGKKKPNLLHAMRTTLKIRPFVMVLLLRIFQTLGMSLYGAMSFYINVYSVCRGDKSMATSLSGINGIVAFFYSFAMVKISAWLTQRLGKRRGLIVGFGAAVLGAVLLPFFAHPGRPYLLLSHMMIFSFFGILTTLFMNAVMPDICDLDELESGERREGLFFSVLSFVTKIETSLLVVLGGYLVAFSGFDPQMAKQMGQQMPNVLVRMRWLGFTPLIICNCITFLIVLRFPITRQMMDDVRARLAARR